MHNLGIWFTIPSKLLKHLILSIKLAITKKSLIPLLYNKLTKRIQETADNLYDYIGDFVYKEEFWCEVAEVGIFVAEGSDSVNFEVLTFFINKNVHKNLHLHL